MNRLVWGAVCVASTAASAVLFVGATEETAQATTVATTYAFKADAYGTRVRGGQVPAGSDMTAFRVIGCTNKAGITKDNHIVGSPLGGLGSVGVVATRLTTTKVGTVYTSLSKSTIAGVQLGDPATTGSLSIQGVTAVAKAWHDSSGYHATTDMAIAKISLSPPGGGQAQTLPIPTPNRPVVIPGLATITVGASVTHEYAGAAVARANVIVVEIPGSSTKINIGHANAVIQGGITHGLFHGSAFASRADAAQSNLTSGPTPFQPMPCLGTKGKVVENDTAGLNLGGQVVIGAETASVQGAEGKTQTWGISKSTVASVDIGGGQLVITGIVGQVTTIRTATKLTSTIAGSTIRSITANGSPQTLPDTGVLEIPGVAKLESNVITKTKVGWGVVALRITLLDGSGAVIDLGNAKMQILTSGF